jgi:ABC-2 type transport system permease protein
MTARELTVLCRARLAASRYWLRGFLSGSLLRVVVVTGLVALFWLLMFAMFWDVFHFLNGDFEAIADIVVDYLFAFLFLSLLVMMTISDAIIAYTSLFRSEETEFLFSLPVLAESTFAYRSSDSMAFSVWGIATLVVPLIVAYGLEFPVPWYFFPIGVALSLLFVVLAAELGALLALAVAVMLRSGRRRAFALLPVAAAVALVAWALPFRQHLAQPEFSEVQIRSIIDRIAFCQHWALPSHWVSHGMLAAARGHLRESLFLGALLLSNVLFLGMVAHRLASYLYRTTWAAARGRSRRRSRRPSRFLPATVDLVAFPAPVRLRLLLVKDARTFLRDPSQWSQFLLFFGLLGLYIVNLPRFQLELLESRWHSLISVLNLWAACLTLATLTTRFVFPQLSLEGRRIWLLGLLPVRRHTVLWGKFLFAVAGTFLVAGGLIALSDAILRLPPWVVAAHVLVVLCVCCGLNGLAVGLGAVYPQLGTDNPSKIVGSFGGTLNLIASICFVAVAVAPIVVPLHLHMVGAWSAATLAWALPAGFGVLLLVSTTAMLAPMLIGARAFARMEF